MAFAACRTVTKFGLRTLSCPKLRLVTSIKQLSRNSSTSGGPGKRRSTIDPEETARFAEKFSYETWWTSREGAGLRAMNELRVPLIRDNLVGGPIESAKPLNGLKIVDVGSGGGILSEPLARLGASVTGLDPVQQNVQSAMRHLEEVSPDLKQNLQYNCTSIEEFSAIEANKNLFDALVTSEVLEHVDDVHLFLQCAHKVIKPNGKLFLTTINQTTAAYLLAILVAENVLHVVPRGTHSYNKLIPLNGLRLMLAELDFNVDLIHGMCFNPLNGKWSWSGITAVNYALAATKN